jgi:uncharacterized protein (DUF2461 family)
MASRPDHPTVGVSRLRASGAIKPDSTSIELFGRPVGVVHRIFPNGGSWSFFVAPCCGRRVRTLRLINDRMLCWRCDGFGHCTHRDRIERLRERLYGGPARLNPRPGRTLERRQQLEASLRRALIVERRKALENAR